MSYLPCVGCGWCCLTDQCVESRILHGYKERCPDLHWDEGLGLYRCGLSSNAGFRHLLSMGEGCCAPLNVWRKDVRNRDGG
ncbi:MAG: hypothetical protein ACOZEN_05495 [Thermodesulfobacteriota bacterium]